MFKSLTGEKFQGEQYNAPIVDILLGIDETRLIEKIDSILIRMFGYMGVALLKQGLLSFVSKHEDYNIIPMTHNFHDLYKFASKFQLKGMRKEIIESINIDRFKYNDRFLNHLISLLLTGHQERITTVNKYGIINSQFYFAKNIPYNSPLLKGLFDNLDLSKPKNHDVIRNEFINWFYGTEENPKYDKLSEQSKMFYEGRIIIRNKINQMLYDQISSIRIVNEFSEEINKMVQQVKDRSDRIITTEEESEIREQQVEIKRRQVIRFLTDYYTEILLNPQGQPHAPRPAGAGDIVKYIKDLLRDPDIKEVPIGFSYSGTYSFYRNFRLKFNIEYFDSSDLSKILPTLAFTYTGTFTNDKGVRSNNEDLIKNLFNAEVLFSQSKENILETYNLLYRYFEEYLIENDVSGFTVEYMKELPQGFQSDSKLGHNRWNWIDNKFITNEMKEELASTYQVFIVKDLKGEILELELKKMISSIIYYVNHYDCNARILEGDSPRKKTLLALALSNSELLEDNYFIGTYNQEFSYKELSQKAIDLYYSEVPLGSHFSYSDTYRIINKKNNKISTYLLQAGSQDKMRSLYEIYLRNIAQINNGEEIIQDLGYNSHSL
jgi:hypothetical protein